jgi:hypothetical protein
MNIYDMCSPLPRVERRSRGYLKVQLKERSHWRCKDVERLNAHYAFLPSCDYDTIEFDMQLQRRNLSLGARSMPPYYFRKPKGILLRYTSLPGGSMKGFDMGRTLRYSTTRCPKGRDSYPRDGPALISWVIFHLLGHILTCGISNRHLHGLLFMSSPRFKLYECAKLHERSGGQIDTVRTPSDKNGSREPWQW